VVIRDFDFIGVLSFPTKTDTILVIDPNVVLTLSVSMKPFEPVSWRNSEFEKFTHSINLVQLTPGYWPDGALTNATRQAGIGSVEYILGSTIPKRTYHGIRYNSMRYSCQESRAEQDYKMGTLTNFPSAK
jgi:hypothetical protein